METKWQNIRFIPVRVWSCSVDCEIPKKMPKIISKKIPKMIFYSLRANWVRLRLSDKFR